MKDIDKYLDTIGPVGSMSRLKAIAKLNLGIRSETAKKVIKNRMNKRNSTSNNQTK